MIIKTSVFIIVHLLFVVGWAERVELAESAFAVDLVESWAEVAAYFVHNNLMPEVGDNYAGELGGNCSEDIVQLSKAELGLFWNVYLPTKQSV